MALQLDADQRFTCQACGRCCRRGWEISLTLGEVGAYRRAQAARWYRDREELPEGTALDPFEPLPAHAPFHRIRKREDGACGFLSPENRCRIHEELGEARKPLTCRMFPYRFHPADAGPVVTTSFSCPTVVTNKGETLGAQVREIGRLGEEWFRVFPEKPRSLAFVPGRSIAEKSLGTLREVLRQMLDRPGPNGVPDLRANVGRMARTLEDLSRYRVLRLPDDGFAEYIELTTKFAARADKPITARPPAAVARILFRGFLYMTVASRQQLGEGRTWGLRPGLRLKRLRVLAHFHGLAPGLPGASLTDARRAAVSFDDPSVHGLAHNYLRAAVQTLGTGKWPVLHELSVAVSFLNAGSVLAAMRAGAAGRETVDGATFTEGLMDAVDLTHAETGGILGSLLASLASGVDALYLFESGRLL